jgi:predicted GIY-YIG superfamily endonuclease
VRPAIDQATLPRGLADRTAVYIGRGEQDVVLYVGVAVNWGRRWAQHSERSPWFPSILRVEVEWFDSRQAALDRETALIRQHRPRFNIRKNGERLVRPGSLPREPRPRAGRRGLEIGWWVVVYLREPVAKTRALVGQVQYVGRRGLRITGMDWLIGAAAGWDEWIPWSNVLGCMVATDEHDLSGFGGLDGAAARTQTRHGETL